MSPIRRTFYLSDVEVSVTSTLPEVQKGLTAIWGTCARPLLPVTAQRDIVVEEAPEGYDIRLDGEAVVRIVDRVDVLAAIEAQIYLRLCDWVRGDNTVLHASAVTREGSTLLFVGRSGSGKSTLALAAVKRGFAYITDEMVLTDGARLWGIPRAIQFDPIPADAPLPPWLGSADHESYVFRDRHGRRSVTPLVPLGPQGPVPTPVPISGLHVVRLARGAPSLGPLAPVDALAALHEATHGAPRMDLGRLTSPGRCWALSWEDGAQAMAALEGRLSSRSRATLA